MIRSERRRIVLLFAAFGLVWGGWGAAIPDLQRQLGLDDTGLSTALLAIAVGAISAMLVTGRMRRPLSGSVALAGVAVAYTATGLAPTTAAFFVALFGVGLLSGATDVAINAAAAVREARDGRPLVHLAHGAFSVAVVVAALVVGGARRLGVEGGYALCVVSLVTIAVAVVARGPSTPDLHAADATVRAPGRRLAAPLIVALGAVGMLALAVESGFQSWSALLVERELHATPLVGGAAAAAFAFGGAAGRLGSHGALQRHGARTVLGVAGAVAVVGCVATAVAPWAGLALAGIVGAGVGVSVLYPWALAESARRTDGTARRAVSAVTTIAYAGFFLGPALMGAASDGLGLRGAFAVLGIATALAVVGAVALCRPRVAAAS